MKNINTPQDLIDILPLTVEITQKHLDKGDKESPFDDPLALAIIDTLKTIVTSHSFKQLQILSRVHWASIKINRHYGITVVFIRNGKQLSVKDITTPTEVQIELATFNS